jgi:hypothetical protein
MGRVKSIGRQSAIRYSQLRRCRDEQMSPSEVLQSLGLQNCKWIKVVNYKGIWGSARVIGIILKRSRHSATFAQTGEPLVLVVAQRGNQTDPGDGTQSRNGHGAGILIIFEY